LVVVVFAALAVVIFAALAVVFFAALAVGLAAVLALVSVAGSAAVFAAILAPGFAASFAASLLRAVLLLLRFPVLARRGAGAASATGDLRVLAGEASAAGLAPRFAATLDTGCAMRPDGGAVFSRCAA
jgi:hypothetical protein